MELRHLKTFVTVAALRSFQKAADVLYYAQSTVSEQIKNLEFDVNAQLFDRTRKTLRLTTTGERLLRYAQKMLDLEDEILSDIRGDGIITGALTVRVPESISTYFMSGIVEAFMEQYPGVLLMLRPCTLDALRQELHSGVIDLAFLQTLDPIRDPMIEAEILGTIDLVIVSSTQNSCACSDTIELDDFRDQALFLSDGDCSYRVLLEKTLAENHITPKIVHTVNSNETIKACVRAGLGVTIMPRFSIEDEIVSGRMKAISVIGHCFSVNLLMMWRNDKWLSPALSGFMGIARMKCRSRLG